MKEYLLDTNVHSEPGKAHPDPKVLDWLRAAEGRWLIPAVVPAERYAGSYGPRATRGEETRRALDVLRRSRPDLVADLTAEDAAAFGAYVAGRERQAGGAYDRLISAQAIARGLAVATRNLDDFPGVPRLNPWTGERADLPASAKGA